MLVANSRAQAAYALGAQDKGKHSTALLPTRHGYYTGCDASTLDCNVLLLQRMLGHSY
jgi:hypothetical protein